MIGECMSSGDVVADEVFEDGFVNGDWPFWSVATLCSLLSIELIAGTIRLTSAPNIKAILRIVLDLLFRRI